MKIVVGPMLALLVLGLHWLFPLSDFPILLPVIAVVAWMVTWWVQKPVNIAWTSLLPLLVFPLMGILPFAVVFKSYFSDIILLFLGGFLMGLMLEKWHLHEKLAFFIIQKSGSSMRSLVLGLMLASYLISMWISNTATAIMMMPIALSVFKAYDTILESRLSQRVKIAGLLGVAYGANIGGIATLVGTPPNIVLKGFLQQQGVSLGFMEWAQFGIPFSLLFLLGTYFITTRFLFVLPTDTTHPIDFRTVFKNNPLETGLTIAQKRALLLFGSAAFLWITGQLWNNLFEQLHISFSFTDSGIALSIALIAFLLPSDKWNSKRLIGLSELPSVSWSILFMFGGGMAMAKGLQEAGFVTLISKFTHDLPPSAWLFAALFFVLVCVFLTELMSNVALITIVLPVILAVSTSLQMQSPLVMAIPATIASSLAFMMPIATPPNAIVFASGSLALHDMMKAGFWLNILAVLSLFLLILILFAVYA